MSSEKIIPSKYNWALCISHDVDHLRHYFNFNLMKFWGVSFIELLYRRRGFGSFISAIANSFRRRDSWDQVKQLAAIDRKYKIPADFFFAVKKGKGIDYGIKELESAVKKLKCFEIGVHGQSVENSLWVNDEFYAMYEILGKRPHGVRMHYLNLAEHTHDLLKRAGYIYDSTKYSEKLEQPCRMPNRLIEIPLHIMDTYLFSPFYKNFTLGQAKEYTKKLISRAQKERKILHIVFHARHFAAEFERQRAYYLWLLDIAEKDKKCYKISCMEIAKKLGK